MAEPNRNTLILSSDSGLKEELGQKLSAAGYAIDNAGSSQDGLMKMKLNKPGLVFVDLSADVGALDFIEQMKAASSLQAIPVIALYASGGEDTAQKAKQLGAADIAPKDNVDDIMAKTQQLLPGDAQQTQQSQGTSAGQKVVMLIEDDPFLHKIMTEQLQEDSSFDVVSCVDAETALQKLPNKKPDLILLDLLLPGMNGYEFLEKIKATPEWKDIPVVILSNFGQEEDIQRAKQLGAIEFLVKAHYVPEEIISKIKEVLAKL